jgi:hypothetical protein
MMNRNERIEALVALPKLVKNSDLFDFILSRAQIENSFFIPEFLTQALNNVLSWHDEGKLVNWLRAQPEPVKPQKVGLILAGNIPLVGWHDILAVFASGHRVIYKPSTQDQVLVDWFISLLTAHFPSSADYFQKVERLNDIDALIATGSSNTARHFDYYFRHVPRLIRGSKSSLAILYGFESAEQLVPLSDDIFMYFGMGCRNVTKILVPIDYDFQPFMEAMEKYRFLADHNKFINNCIYHKAIFLMNGDPFLENDLLSVREADSIFSPMGVLNYQMYANLDEAKSIIKGHLADMQCLLSHEGQWEGSIPFGTGQIPSLIDYADDLNTLEFLGKFA